ncbi:hypothetical protein F4680DRAFT_421648 [Xylaria scruposa]|nr:hypothetical protein F4680DRAFT_421648 [Xylaria scruposa]
MSDQYDKRFEPRDRTMPLVPEPFEHVATSKQAIALGSQCLAERWCKFCPNLDVSDYRESLSDEKREALNERTSRLEKRAVQNLSYESSEFKWEVLAWHDVFDTILDDEAFRVDKRPYEYVERDANGAPVVKQRVPDATMGLKTYDDWEPKHSSTCTADDCKIKIDHSSLQPDKRLSCHHLIRMMNVASCGLIVDGVWGKASLVFPFAVYEAKKWVSSYEAAEGQIYHACRTYLAMLDDLARDPDNVAEYQTSESSKYQLFAFTSSGPYWQVYAAWNHLNQCFIETIWRGRITARSRAFELICIVDQIQSYAAYQHRPFVMKHLEAWYAKFQREVLESMGLFINAADKLLLDETEEESSDFEELANLLPKDTGHAAWIKLKEDTKVSRSEKAMLTRQKNRDLRELARVQHTENQSDNKFKQGRGHPLKKNGVVKRNGIKRGSGRVSKMSQTTRKGKKTTGRRSRH